MFLTIRMIIRLLILDENAIIIQNQIQQNYADSLSENVLVERIPIHRAYWLCSSRM